MTYPITSILAVVFTVIYLCLSIRVPRIRKRVKAAFGDNGDADLQRAIRAHGNFAEYVPLGLFLILLVESAWGHVAWYVGVLLLAGRAAHIYSVLVHEPKRQRYNLRIAGMMTTFAAYALAALLLAYAWAMR